MILLMKVSICVSGKIESKRERIQCQIEVPDNWKPTFEEFCKVKGTLRMLIEKLDQEFSPPPHLN